MRISRLVTSGWRSRQCRNAPTESKGTQPDSQRDDKAADESRQYTDVQDNDECDGTSECGNRVYLAGEEDRNPLISENVTNDSPADAAEYSEYHRR